MATRRHGGLEARCRYSDVEFASRVLELWTCAVGVQMWSSGALEGAAGVQTWMYGARKLGRRAAGVWPLRGMELGRRAVGV